MNGLLGTLCGAGFGIGLLMIRRSLRPAAPTPSEPNARPRRVRLDASALLLRWRRLLVCLVTGVAAGAATGWPVAVVLGAAGCWWLPAMLGRDRESEHAIARTEGCASFAEMLRDTLSAASGLSEAILAASAVPPAAIAEPLRVLHADLRHGLKTTDAIRKLADTLADPVADLICATLIHATGRPSRNLAATLSALASEARAQALAMRRTMAARAQVRTSVRVVTGVILGITATLLIADSTYLKPFATAAGQLDLAVAGGLFAAAFAWLVHIARPVPAPRFLTRLDSLAQDPEGDDLPVRISPRPRTAQDRKAVR